MVLQEDGDPNNGGVDRNRCSPKKPKTNKIPQRGLGIAALEKLRREEQQRRMTTGDKIANAAVTGVRGEHSADAGLIAATPFIPFLEPNSKPCDFRNYALFRPHSNPGDGSSPLVWNSIPSESSSRLPLLSRKQQQEQQRCSLVMKNFLSSPSSSGASLQMEPPSNQSSVSICHPSMPEEQKLASMKRSWPFQPGSALTVGNVHKRIAFSRDEASRDEGEAAKLDGSLLSLGLLPVSEPSSMQKIPFQKHYLLSLQHIQVQKSKEQNTSEAVDLPTIYNFMGLPHDLIGSNPTDAHDESKDEC